LSIPAPMGISRAAHQDTGMLGVGLVDQGAGKALLSEWGGALHWLTTTRDPDSIFAFMAICEGHATLFRQGDSPRAARLFQPLPAIQLQWHRNLKKAFDPAGIFNPGHMHTEF